MTKPQKLLNKLLFFLPRAVLWGICMIYFLIAILFSFDRFAPYAIRLELLRDKAVGRMQGS